MTTVLDSCRRVHFVGIGGIGMSALARLLLAKGYQVSGSDRQPGEQGEALARLGARIMPGHDARYVDGAELVVVTSAVGPDNPEIRAAAARQIPVMKRAELLAAILNPSFGIAIAGTHGKSTTTALIGHLLAETGRDPTILVGGISTNLGSNTRVGSSGLVVAEADEYDASFLRLRPRIAVITNLDPEHLDFYGTVDRLHVAFAEFARRVSETLVICADDPILPGLVQDVAARVLTYGLEEGEWRASEIREDGEVTRFRAGRAALDYELTTRLAGAHNVRNALAALAVGDALGVPFPAMAQSLATFQGVARRFEIKGEVGGILVIDDYAHHPTEIRANLLALRQRFSRPIRLIFQPHTFSRTQAFLDEFSQSFAGADIVYLLDIYAARETDTLGVCGRDLAVLAGQEHGQVRYTETMEATLEALVADARPGDLVVTMGAGDVYHLGPALLQRLGER